MTSFGQQQAAQEYPRPKDPEKEPQVAPLRSPGFPVENRGVGNLHAALSTESRTRGSR
jgi:hypothetical protein